MAKKTEVERFKRDWDVDFPNRIVKRKNLGFFRRVWEKIWEPRYRVIAFYRFTREKEYGAHIVNIDNMPGRSPRFELNANWDIPEKDRWYLVSGPLTKGVEIIIPTRPLWKRNFANLWNVAKLIYYISMVGGIIIVLVLFATGSISF